MVDIFLTVVSQTRNQRDEIFADIALYAMLSKPNFFYFSNMQEFLRLQVF